MKFMLRVCLLLVFALYWGGLTFYTGFVVRIAHDVLSDPMDGGLITQRVTGLLQIFAVVMLALMVINAVVVAKNSKRLGRALGGCTLVLAISVIGLFIVHAQLDAVIDVQNSEIIDREAFTIGHRRYNRLTAVEWIATLAYLPLTIVAWRKDDLGQ